MDDETAEIILAVQIEDLQNLITGRKGKRAMGSAMTDEEVSVNLQLEELQRLQTLLADIRMTRSISRAVQDDGAAIVVHIAEERRSTQDHETACRLSGQATGSVAKISDYHADDEVLSRFGLLNIGYDDDAKSCFNELVVSFSDVNSGESSTWAAKRANVRKKPWHECVACSELTTVAQAPCQHYYCGDCTVRLFRDAITDETLFPIRCCGQEMPLSLVRHFLSSELAAQFERKSIEYRTKDRTYCAKVSCGQFIYPDLIDGHTAICSACDQRTCTLCKRTSHTGNCRKDGEMEELLELARAAGWQRCFQCRAMIELQHGCNHLTCRCGAQFCYSCGQRWKTCQCVHFDEHRLYARANVIADRSLATGPAAPRAERVQQIAQELRDRHECDHQGRWRRVDGSHRCEECNYLLPSYILECRHCMLRACVRCTRNRL